MSYLETFSGSVHQFTGATKTVMRAAWKENPRQLTIVVTLSLFLGLMPYAVQGVQALLLNQLVTAFGTHVWESTIILLVVAGILAISLRDSFQGFLQYTMRAMWIEQRQTYEMRISEKLAGLDVATHEDKAFKDEFQALNEQGGTFAIANFLSSIIQNAQNMTGVITASVIVISVDWTFFVLIFVACLPHLYTELRYGQGMWTIHESNAELRRQYHESRRHLMDASGIRELHTFQTSPFFLERLRILLKEFLDAQRKEERRKLGFMLLSQALLGGALLFALYMLVSRVIGGTLQVGTFTFVFGAILGLEGTISAFLIAIANQRNDARMVDAFEKIMRRERIVRNPTRGCALACTRAPRIEFRNVTFAYPSSSAEVLKNFSLAIEPGERFAIVGDNGTGKSTLINLLCRFYDPTKGAVLVDGIDLREIDLESWYRHLALLGQEFQTYRVKAWELINLGRHDERNQAGIERVARQAEAHRFIETWKDRYDQQIGVDFSNGVGLSGGQRQSLALARTLYRDAFVTVLDEPTANIDPGAERRFFDTLEQAADQSQTLILISHRFSTVRGADRICVLKNGAVAELGNHAELVKKGGTYAELFEQQAERYR